ncbi:MAG: indole-3-glycerol phosphate synthase TrpC [Acidobacteriota bacterium]
MGEIEQASGAGDIPDILAKIVERRHGHIGQARNKETFTRPPRRAEVQGPGNNPFLSRIEAHRGRAVIAEIKLGSPSLGSLVGTFDPVERAESYARAGAACLSVVVEPDFFHGSYEILTRCVEATGLPAIAKDFVVDPLQLDWAQHAGAEAVLLIAALYSPDELREFARQARGLGLVPLIETHDASDVAKLEGAEWELVGVNNRDLRTFSVSLDTSRELYGTLPEGAFKVAESGIRSGADLRSLAASGFDAFLIGEALVTAGDPEGTLQDMLRPADAEHG